MTTTTSPEHAPALIEPTYKAKEVAADLRVDVGAVYDLIRNGELRAVRIGRLVRIPESALSEYLRGSR